MDKLKIRTGNKLLHPCELFINISARTNIADKAKAIAVFDDLKKKQARNFQNYLRKHRFRIPDYQLYQELSICIGSGSVESWIKQIASRVKIIGAQCNPKNVSQMLRLRCAYLNQSISLGIYA